MKSASNSRFRPAEFLVLAVHVLAERRRPRELLVAHFALVRALAGVTALVLLEVRRATHSLSADVAHVRLLVRVDAPVLEERTERGERLRALIAGERLRAAVALLVLVELALACEAVTAPEKPAVVGIMLQTKQSSVERLAVNCLRLLFRLPKSNVSQTCPSSPPRDLMRAMLNTRCCGNRCATACVQELRHVSIVTACTSISLTACTLALSHASQRDRMRLRVTTCMRALLHAR